jgi:hypothetical protein
MMLSATPMIDPGVVNCFADKRVRIYAQHDESGIAAAWRWQNRLETVGAITDIWIPPRIQLPDGGFTKDLDDLFWKLDPNIKIVSFCYIDALPRLRDQHRVIFGCGYATLGNVQASASFSSRALR